MRFVAWMFHSCRNNGRVVIRCHFLIAAIENGFIACVASDAGFQVVRDEQPRRAAKVTVGMDVTHEPVFYKGSLTAIHQRLLVPQYHPVVKPEHMPPEHRQYLHYKAEDFSRWADSVGHNTGKVVHMFLTGGREPEQGFKACTSMTKMAAKYGEKRLEEACSRLLLLSTPPSIRTLRTILQNNECRTAFSQSANADITEGNSEDLPSMPEHGIIRGAKYFRKGGASK